MKTFPARVATSASANESGLSRMNERARSSTANAAWPSFRWAMVGRRPSRLEQAPPADAEDQLLEQPHLGPAPVQLGGDATVPRQIERIVRVEQIQADAADAREPRAQPQRTAGELERHADPGAIGTAQRLDGHRHRIVVGIGLVLPAVPIDRLPKVALLIQDPDPHRGQPEVARRLEEVAGEDPEAAGIERDGLAETELHAEIGDQVSVEARGAARAPGARTQVGPPLFGEPTEAIEERAVRCELAEPAGGDLHEREPGIARSLPDVLVERSPQRVRCVTPGPPQIERELDEW